MYVFIIAFYDRIRSISADAVDTGFAVTADIPASAAVVDVLRRVDLFAAADRRRIMDVRRTAAHVTIFALPTVIAASAAIR